MYLKSAKLKRQKVKPSSQIRGIPKLNLKRLIITACIVGCVGGSYVWISRAGIASCDRHPDGTYTLNTACIEDSSNAYVARTYRVMLGRIADESGLQYWAQQIDQGKLTRLELIEQFMSSTEYSKTQLTNEEFINDLYAQALGREPDQSGKEYWVTQLNSGVQTRAAVAQSFISSAESKSFNRGYVVETLGSGKQVFGISVGGEFFSLSDSNFAAQEQLIKKTGVKQLRSAIKWSAVQPTAPPRNSDGSYRWKDSTYNWARADRLLDFAQANGITLLVNANPASSPGWARSVASSQLSSAPAPPQDPQAFAQFLKALALHAKGRGTPIKNWQIGNEPNVVLRWGGTPDPKAYVAILRAAYNELKSVDGKNVVLTAGMGANYGPQEVPGNIMAPNFIKAMYANGAKGSFDALSYHPYDILVDAIVGRDGYKELLEVRKLMVSNGDSGKNIWVTEYGVPSAAAGVGDNNQALFLKQRIYKIYSNNWVEKVYWYQLTDESTNGYGIFRQDARTATFSPKPALTSFRSLL